MFLPQYAYIGLLCGTVVFSLSAGLSEVLLSPIIAAIPSKNPDRDMSLLHSLYAIGLVWVILVSTLFLRLFGTENWAYLTIFWAVIPIASFALFALSPLPQIQISHEKGSSEQAKRRISGSRCV